MTAAEIPEIPGESGLCPDCAEACAQWRRIHASTVRGPDSWTRGKSAAEIRFLIQSNRDPRRLAPDSIAQIVEVCQKRHGSASLEGSPHEGTS